MFLPDDPYPVRVLGLRQADQREVELRHTKGIETSYRGVTWRQHCAPHVFSGRRQLESTWSEHHVWSTSRLYRSIGRYQRCNGM